MKAILTRASDYGVASFQVNSLEQIEELMEKEGEIILRYNDFYGDDPSRIKDFFDINDDELAKWISESKYEITIYDDYIE